MATSGSTDWSLTRDTAITMALRKLAVIPSGGSLTNSQISDSQDALNALVKAFQADGMPLWKVSSQTFTTVSGTSSYTVGIGQTVSCPKPLKIIQAYATPSGGTNTPLDVYTRYDFNDLPQGTTYTGDPTILYYQPLRTTGTIKLWPTPDDSTTVVTFQYQSPYEDMDFGDNDFDFPSEWMMAIVYALAWVMAPEYGVPINDRVQLQREADYWHQYALSMGSEEGGIFIQPNREM